MIYDWRKTINCDELNNVVEALNNGELIIFPTETVYGIGADAFSHLACSKIYEAKGRPSDNPLIVHVSDLEMLNKCVKGVSDIERRLIDAFMPGPLTLILEKSEIVPDEVTANLDTVAIRMPCNEIAKKIISEFGRPIAAPSANVSGRPSGTRINDIREELEDKVFALIDGGDTEIGLESTVVKVIDDVPTILRPGGITAEDIEVVIGKVDVDSHILSKVSDDEKVESPGMKHRHYAPKTKCVLVDIENEVERIGAINRILNERTCVIGFEEHRDKINAQHFLSMGTSLEDASKKIFALLREADLLKCDLIVIEGVPAKGIGLAIMNRLIRTCDYNVISKD